MRTASLLTVMGTLAALGVSGIASADTYMSLVGMAAIPEGNDYTIFTRDPAYHGGVALASFQTSDKFVDFPLPVVTQSGWGYSQVDAYVTMAGNLSGTANCQLVGLTHNGQDDSWGNPVASGTSGNVRLPLVSIHVEQNGTAIVRCGLYGTPGAAQVHTVNARYY